MDRRRAARPRGSVRTMPALVLLRTHASTHAHTHTHVPMHTNLHTHMHTQVWADMLSCPCPTGKIRVEETRESFEMVLQVRVGPEIRALDR